MDANELIRRRRQATNDTATEQELIRQRNVERTHTGANAQIVGRNPATGEYQLQIGDVTVSVNNLTNSDYGANNTVQVYDSGSGRPGITSNPSPPPERREDTQSSEERAGTIAVLLDCLVDTESKPSCKDLQDVWALFAIVQYVKPGRVLVMFNFPKETNNPVPYAKARWRFGKNQDNKYACIPTANPTGEYGSYQECSLDNPRVCPDASNGIYPPDTPLNPDGTPNPEFSDIRVTRVPGWTDVELISDGSNPSIYTDYVYSEERPIVSKAFRRTNAFTLIDIGPNIPEGSIKIDGPFTGRNPWIVFYERNGRWPKCGDSMTRSENYVVIERGGHTSIRTSSSSDSFVSTVRESDGYGGSGNVTVTWVWTVIGSQDYGFLIAIPASASAKCGERVARLRLGDLPPNGTNPPPPPSDSICPPREGEPSTIAREFWVGGHIQNPQKLLEINAEEEYEWFGSLMPDGYYVTIKWGREFVSGIERWVKVQSFKTTNLTDWRPVEYHTSYDLVSVSFDDQLSTTINKDSKGKYSIDPNQTVTGAGGQSKPLERELFTRPEGSYSSTIDATIQVTPNDESTVNRPAQIYRIDSVLPSDLNQTVSGCIEVDGVDIMYSPLFSL